jgi:CRP/FNR family transcriptional regulator, cyclic AMP receptor protein
VTETTNTLELLKRVDIFQQVPESALLELLATAETVGVEKGDVIFREGEPGGTMYLVVSGAVELTKAVKVDQSQRLALLDRGQIFGELSLFDDLPRSATAQAFVKSTLLRFQGEAFDRLLHEQQALAPHLLRNLVKKLSLRLRDADEEIRELSRAQAH